MRGARSRLPASEIAPQASVLAFSFFLTGCATKVPTLHGQIPEAQAGDLLEGTIIIRALTKEGSFDLVDTQAPDPIRS